MIWVEADLGVGTLAHKEGTAGVYGAEVRPYYTSMKIISTHQDIDPYGSEAEEFKREQCERAGRRVSFVTGEELDRDARAALAASWAGRSYEG